MLPLMAKEADQQIVDQELGITTPQERAEPEVSLEFEQDEDIKAHK